MKTLNEFKGTKGEFKSTILFEGIEISGDKHRACYVPYKDEEGEANAKLFAASKKLLEAAIEVNRFKSSINYLFSQHLATPNNGIKALDDLEQAINEAL